MRWLVLVFFLLFIVLGECACAAAQYHRWISCVISVILGLACVVAGALCLSIRFR
jgi:hypothetical protein